MHQEKLHPTQILLLDLLSRHADDPLTIRELQSSVQASSPSVIAHHLTQLEKKGYLKRNPYNPKDYQVCSSGPESDIALINLYGMASCGPSGSMLDGNPLDRISISSRLLSFPASDAFMVRAKGRSMEPKINAGDLVIAQRGRPIEDGKTFVCVNGDDCLIKVVRVVSGKFLLESLNREFAPILVDPPSLRVEGLVRNVISGS